MWAPAHLLAGVAGEGGGEVDAVVAADGDDLADAQAHRAPQAAHKHACPHTPALEHRKYGISSLHPVCFSPGTTQHSAGG